MLPILEVEQAHKYLAQGGREFQNVTECYGDITCLYGMTDGNIPFIIKFIEDHTIQIRHGVVDKRFKFTEDNYPL